MTLYPKLITDALATVIYPGTKKNLVESEMVVMDDIHISGMSVKVTLIFPRETDPFLNLNRLHGRKWGSYCPK